MMSRETREIAVQEIIKIAGLVVALYITKRYTSPDAGRILKMHVALTVKRVADQQTRLWERVASKAATTYNRARL